MLFNSLEFIIFFPVVVVVYFLIGKAYRWVFLLAASYYFYMCWKPEYVILIVVSTLIDYFAGLQMGKRSEKRRKLPFLLLSLFSNLGLLFSFKYFNFFNETARAVFERFNLFYGVPAFDVLLPVGISFYTFQTLSYSIDVYRGNKSAEKHLGIFALYVSFFPQLVAGPIERSTRLLPQLNAVHEPEYDRMMDGAKLMAWGFFQKIVIADRVAILVNQVYGDVHNYGSAALLLATYFFAVQIYCDFAGYSNIAIGAAQILGIKLMKNFDRPYFSRSIAEFWSRWHVSLSTWFKDYLYIPLGGNRVSQLGRLFNLALVFVVSGLWHGANWTFIVWGGLHALYMIVAVLSRQLRDRLKQILRLNSKPTLTKTVGVILTFHLVCLSWVFFRANNLGDAWYVLKTIIGGISIRTLPDILAAGFSGGLGLRRLEMLLSILMVALLVGVELLQRKYRLRTVLASQPLVVRWIVYLGGIIAIFLFGSFQLQEFVYFQF
jgi:alginate O-acetyltransferase complex protein AlgI